MTYHDKIIAAWLAGYAFTVGVALFCLRIHYEARRAALPPKTDPNHDDPVPYNIEPWTFAVIFWPFAAVFLMIVIPLDKLIFRLPEHLGRRMAERAKNGHRRFRKSVVKQPDLGPSRTPSCTGCGRPL